MHGHSLGDGDNDDDDDDDDDVDDDDNDDNDDDDDDDDDDTKAIPADAQGRLYSWYQQRGYWFILHTIFRADAR